MLFILNQTWKNVRSTQPMVTEILERLWHFIRWLHQKIWFFTELIPFMIKLILITLLCQLYWKYARIMYTLVDFLLYVLWQCRDFTELNKFLHVCSRSNWLFATLKKREGKDNVMFLSFLLILIIVLKIKQKSYNEVNLTSELDGPFWLARSSS